jgi:hypothetical protein
VAQWRRFLILPEIAAVSLIALMAVAALAAPPQARTPQDEARRPPLSRTYREGERLRYRIVQSETRNGATTVLTAETEHEVARERAGLAERVGWTRMGPPEAPDSRSDEARAVPPYTLSLEPGGGLESPRPAGAVDLLGLITDLQTFWVAVSPGLGADRLAEPGDVHVRPELIVGDFADGEAILSGRDCTRATLTLVSRDAEASVVETRFEPPTTSCLDGAAPADGGPPFNFRMVRRAGEQFLDLEGHESFVITSRLDGGDGKIRSAEMVNGLALHGRVCMDAGLTQCTPMPEVRRERRVTLELVG